MLARSAGLRMTQDSLPSGSAKDRPAGAVGFAPVVEHTRPQAEEPVHLPPCRGRRHRYIQLFTVLARQLRAVPQADPTLGDVSAKKNTPSAEAEAAKEFVKLASDRGLSLTAPDGLLKQFTKNVLETALSEEMTEHLRHEKNRLPQGRSSANVRNGTRPKTVLTAATGPVEIAPRPRRHL